MMTRMDNASRTLSVELFSTVDGYASGTEAEGYFGLYGPELAAWIDEQLALPRQMEPASLRTVEISVGRGSSIWM